MLSPAGVQCFLSLLKPFSELKPFVVLIDKAVNSSSCEQIKYYNEIKCISFA